MEWRREVLDFVGDVNALYLGEVRVGHVADTMTYPRPPDGKITYYCHLPGIPRSNPPFKDAEAAMKAMEELVKDWITKAGLKA